MDIMQREIDKIISKESISVLQDYLSKRLPELIAIDYSAGKIYMIVHKITRKLAYIGSTIHGLHVRFSGHKSFSTNNPRSRYAQYIQAAGGHEAFEMVLIENYPCNSLKELIDREMTFIRKDQPPCNSQINKVEEVAIENFTKTEKNLICPKCGYTAVCSANLDKHLNNKYSCDQGKYKCHNCRFRSNNRTSIYTHRKTCKGSKVPGLPNPFCSVQNAEQTTTATINTSNSKPVSFLDEKDTFLIYMT